MFAQFFGCNLKPAQYFANLASIISSFGEKDASAKVRLLEFNDRKFGTHLLVRPWEDGVSPLYSNKQAVRSLITLEKYAVEKRVFGEVKATMELETLPAIMLNFTNIENAM